MLKINNKDILQVESIQDIPHKCHTEVMACEKVRVPTAIVELAYIPISDLIPTISC